MFALVSHSALFGTDADFLAQVDASLKSLLAIPA
jgi:hypothetical protein